MMQRGMTGLPAGRGRGIVRGMRHILLPLPLIALLAARYASLVGQPKTVVDGMTFPAGTRVILPGTAVTMDFREERLNVLIDGNAVVERVYCG